MRVGFNPNKDKEIDQVEYTHQVIMPVHIPHFEGYFKDSFKILEYSLESLFKTSHKNTYITVVNNGSCEEVKNFLNSLFHQDLIHELIHTICIGKLNAILKGVVGNRIELVTISDADVLFLPNWQQETVKIFENVPKAGVVGIVPQFKMFEANCGNVLFDTFFSKKLKFLPVKNPDALALFYKSIGWANDYNQDYLKYNLGLDLSEDFKVLVGSGHFVATYKKDMFDEVKSYLGYKLGGLSEAYLDKSSLKKDYWRLTTQDNYAYHMGNTLEDWMETDYPVKNTQQVTHSGFSKRKPMSHFMFFLKNRLFSKFISIPFLYKCFLRSKGLPKAMINKY
ncbi:glycosyltransferase family 2 protein [Tamlana haliotis]|uniref:Glycosyltransferase family 2 protein n=1 Tax=Pseudotamlana haliotis TaxID=2614804 RepID=A0A6N6MDK1_9FLAO|nr:glycosyltransferase family A protein [Tamlana haliotis]KAB1067026.1 glycosyltransferase family 2 protein [Tamlana haliotis]